MGYGNFLCGIKLWYEICFGERYKTQVILHKFAKEYYRKIHCLTSEFHVEFHEKNR